MRRIGFCSPPWRTWALVVAVAATATLPASAQPASAPPASAQPAPTRPGMPMSQMAQQRLTQMHERLAITPAEQGAWDQFAQVWTQNAAQLDTALRERAAQLASMNAVQSMQSFADVQVRESQDMQRLVPAFQQLYAALTPQQQSRADAMFRGGSERAGQRAATPR